MRNISLNLLLEDGGQRKLLNHLAATLIGGITRLFFVSSFLSFPITKILASIAAQMRGVKSKSKDNFSTYDVWRTHINHHNFYF